MEVVFSVQLKPKAPMTEREVVAEEVENYVAEHLGIPNVRLINVLGVNNLEGPYFVFESQIQPLAFFRLAKTITGNTLFSNPYRNLDILNSEKRIDPDFDLRNHLEEWYGEIFREYDIKIIR